MQRLNTFFHKHINPQTPEEVKQNLKRNLLLSQYALLSASILEFYTGNSISAGLILTAAFYIEKGAEEYYKHSTDQSKAAYINENYSQLSKLSEYLAPMAKEFGNAVVEDVKTISSYFNRKP